MTLRHECELLFCKEIGRQQRRGRRKPLSAGAGVLFQEPAGVESCVWWGGGFGGGGVKSNRNEVVFLLSCCFTSTEARWPIRDGDRVGRGRQSEGSTAETARKRPERPWTAARTMEVLRRCPLAIAQRLAHCAIAVSTAVLGQSHKDNVRCTAVDEQLGQLEAKDVQLAQPSSTSLLMISSGLTRGSSSTSLL